MSHPFKSASASQIKTYRRCKRRWFWESIRKHRAPPTPAMQFGTKVHSLLESYLETGQVPVISPADTVGQRAWSVCLPGLELLPRPPIPKRQLERGFWLTCFSRPVLGYIDLLETASIVTDHKTLSDFKYVRSRAELESDPQALLYGAVANAMWSREPDRQVRGNLVTTVDHPHLDTVKFRHVYYRTRVRPWHDWGGFNGRCRRCDVSPNDRTPCITYLTPREALQRLGTEWGRACYPDVWAEAGVRRAKELLHPPRYDAVCFGGEQPQPAPLVLLTDCRFENESAAIRREGGRIVRITRPGAGGDTHASETEQATIKADWTIDNSGTLDDLRLLARAVVASIEAATNVRQEKDA